MQLNEFVKMFLPDYEQKWQNMPSGSMNDFIHKYFPEALQNFADKLCQKQRENCASENCIIDGAYNDICIRYALQPSIAAL